MKTSAQSSLYYVAMSAAAILKLLLYVLFRKCLKRNPECVFYTHPMRTTSDDRASAQGLF